jgi:hypothetical protein
VSGRTATILAWTLVGASTVVTLVGTALFETADDEALGQAHATDAPAVFLFSVVVLVFFVSAIVGALIASRLPSNPIGWILVGMVVAVGVSAGADGYVAVSLERGHEGGLVAWAAEYSDDVFVAFFAMVFFTLLLFPDGRPLTPRWRAVLWTGTAGLVLCSAAVVLQPGAMDNFPELTSPAAVDSPVLDWLFLPAFAVFGSALVAAAVSIVLRFLRSRGVERQQLKVLLAAGVAGTAAFVVGVLVTVLSGSEDLGITMTMVGVLAIPVGMGVAMLRYRLYDVDRLISRSLTYALVTAVLAAAYAGLVLAGQALFSSVAGGGDLAIAVSTLVVAALFLPLRSRVQRVVDRRFYRRRYDAQRTLEAFGARLREETDLRTLTDDLGGVIAETMQPSGLSIWRRTPP